MIANSDPMRDKEETPFSIAQKFSQGEISREDTIQILGQWDYVPDEQTDGYNFLIFDIPGSFSEVTQAFTQGLLDADAYNEIIDIADERYN